NDELIAADLAKEVGLIVLASDKTVSPTLNCWCEELESMCNKEHSRVLNLEAEVLEKQQMLTKSEQQMCETLNATASNALFENNKLKAQLQERDDVIRHLQAEKDILSLLTVGPTDSNLDTKALETENAQLKKSFTSFKVTHATLDRCYQELSKANNHLRSTSLEKIAAQREEIATLKAEAVGKKMNGPTGTPKPKVLASMMYTKRSKYIVPPRKADWVPSTPLPKKKQVTPQEPQRASPRFTQKPPIQHKKPTIPVNSFSQSKPATEARKPIPKRHSLNSNPFSSKSVQARRAAEYNRNLYVDISQFVDCSSKSVKTKPHRAKRVVNTSGNARKNTKEEVARIVPIWKPTGTIFILLINNLHGLEVAYYRFREVSSVIFELSELKTKIHVDNKSASCVVKNHVYHSKTKHIEIRNHFIRDSNEKMLIEMVKIHTDYNMVDPLIKGFDVTRF
nr:putative ribonuclease H-like domain-containing protein [Tanacetum cinerariifolium]